MCHLSQQHHRYDISDIWMQSGLLNTNQHIPFTYKGNHDQNNEPRKEIKIKFNTCLLQYLPTEANAYTSLSKIQKNIEVI